MVLGRINFSFTFLYFYFMYFFPSFFVFVAVATPLFILLFILSGITFNYYFFTLAFQIRPFCLQCAMRRVTFEENSICFPEKLGKLFSLITLLSLGVWTFRYGLGFRIPIINSHCPFPGAPFKITTSRKVSG